jgi:hypothetical protein
VRGGCVDLTTHRGVGPLAVFFFPSPFPPFLPLPLLPPSFGSTTTLGFAFLRCVPASVVEIARFRVFEAGGEAVRGLARVAAAAERVVRVIAERRWRAMAGVEGGRWVSR